MRKFVYIGQRFYLESSTRMGNMLEIRNGKYYRAGTGDIEIAVMDGEEVHVRPANRKELAAAEAELARITGSRRSW